MAGQWEWIIILVLVVALLVWELRRTRRAIAQAAREQAERDLSETLSAKQHRR